MRGYGWLVHCFLLLSLATGCGDSQGSHRPHVARTSGDAVALSYDERIAVVTNRSANSVTVLSLKPERGLKEMVARKTTFQLDEGSEPWAAIVGADDDTAFVLLRHASQVLRIDHLRHGPSLYERRVSVGSEPVSLALTPTGKTLYVANSADGRLTMINVASFSVKNATELDLNSDLVKTGVLGDGVEGRSGLAHPQALAISDDDDGDDDDDDETLFATEFFAQNAPGTTRDLSEVDRNHVGLVYTRRVRDGQPGPTIEFSPVRNTGFSDSNGNPTSCFPNQLYAAAVDRNSLYVTAMCTSPQGPLDRPALDATNTANFKTLAHAAVFVADVSPGRFEESPEQAHLLTTVLQNLYAQDGETARVRMPLIPNDIAFRARPSGGRSAYVLSLGSDTFFRLDYAIDGLLTGIGSKQHRFVAPLPDAGYAVGLATTQRTDPAFALAYSDVAQQLSVVDLTTETRVATIDTTEGDQNAAAIKSSAANKGKGLFASGLGIWSLDGQGWSSCETCHPGGGSDNVVWYFSRGPRRSLPTYNAYDKHVADPAAATRRLLLWGANVDEIHDVEVIVRTVSGGAGAINWNYPPPGRTSNDCRIVYDGRKLPKSNPPLCGGGKATTTLRNGLNGSLASVVSQGACANDQPSCDSAFGNDWNLIDAFIRQLRVPNAPSTLDADRVKAGRALFEKSGCANCHGGPLFTVSTLFYTPSGAENGAVPSPYDGKAPESLPDPGAALGRLRQATYAVPSDLARLNPAANTAACADTGSCTSTFRLAPADRSPEGVRKFLYGDPSDMNAVDAAARAAGNDQLLCALRDVGTFPPQQPMPTFEGIVPANQSPPLEYRQDGSTLAQGERGFNVPSLLGLAGSAPYFHAGNARTLEELFDAAFLTHTKSGAADAEQKLSTPEARSLLVDFLLSVDSRTEPFETPSRYDFCAAK
jgi:hypothetical protein